MKVLKKIVYLSAVLTLSTTSFADQKLVWPVWADGKTPVVLDSDASNAVAFSSESAFTAMMEAAAASMESATNGSVAVMGSGGAGAAQYGDLFWSSNSTKYGYGMKSDSGELYRTLPQFDAQGVNAVLEAAIQGPNIVKKWDGKVFGPNIVSNEFTYNELPIQSTIWGGFGG